MKKKIHLSKPLVFAATLLYILGMPSAHGQTPPPSLQAVSFEDMPSNHNSDPDMVPQLKRANGQVQIGWAGIRARLLRTAQEQGIDPASLESLTVSIYQNGVEVQKNLPWNQLSTILSEAPTGQMDYYVVYKRNGQPVDISKWVMRETADGQNLAAGSFSGKFTGEAFGVTLNKELKEKGFNEELTETSVRLGNLKVVWVLRPGANHGVADFIRQSAQGVDVKADIGSSGTPERVVIRDRATDKSLQASVNDFYFKVDAAFNGNAFFWDDMLVALATAPYHSWLAKSTMEFWLDVQNQNQGVIPREVRKDSLISLWFPENVRFPEKPKANLSYTNPYLMNWVADKLYRYNPSPENLELLKRVSNSVNQYAAWMEQNRAVRDRDGRIVGFNGSSLGTGLDNSRGEVGNDNEDRAHRHGFVDFLSQHISMLKDNAKWNMIFAREAKSDTEKARYVGAARDLQKRALAYQKVLNEHYWNEEKQFYFDIDVDANGKITQDLEYAVISGFWPLYAKAADREKVNRIVESQFHQDAFGGDFPFPANARHTIVESRKVRYTPRPNFKDEDGYWDKWAHWPSMAMMVAQGLRKSGRPDVALQTSGDFVKQMSKSSTRTVEESYGEIRSQGADGKANFTPRVLQHASHPHRADFAGWGKGPGLENTLEDGLGINPTYRRGLEWNLRTNLAIGQHDVLGVHLMQYMGGTIKTMNVRRLTETDYELTVQSEKPFQLRLASLVDAKGVVQPDLQFRGDVVQVEGGNKLQVLRVRLQPAAGASGRRCEDVMGR